ncbi:type II secretion system protein GspG [Alginatibacterium sediminis]|uniref:Type II secretion system core protein G n=1 Tax=Alginatibacterium sediminis TaxID=2164068 RepID=A0A420E6S4_9ALTE|nr:type II secretion system major pseudopilin GspG [Alginatibacterium sediminis]RKF13195.1 type II secretion system protein GspG [Alginatibacterium sediminis]
MKAANKRQATLGFTLLEVMVVVVILGILASVVVPNLMGNKDVANRQKVKSDLVSFENQLDLYRLANDRYPTTEQGLEALVEKPTIEPLPRRYPEDGYLRRLQQDPWGNDYILISPGENGKIDVFSMGPDGEEGTEDDLGNWDMDF